MLNAVLFITLCLSWGTTWVAIKVGVAAVPPLYFAGTRFLIAGALILMIAAIMNGWRSLLVKASDWRELNVMSLLVVSVCFALIFWGEQFVSAGMVAIVVQGAIPILLPLFTSLLTGEKFKRTSLLSGLVGLAGLGVIFAHGIVENNDSTALASPTLLGLLAIVLGTVSYCYGSVKGRPLLARNSPVAIAGWQNLIGGAMTLVGSLIFEIPSHTSADYLAIFRPDVLFAWIWLVVVGSAIGFVLYIVLLKAWGPARLSPYAFATPVVAIFIDFALFGNHLSLQDMAGVGLIFTALTIAFYKPKVKATDSPSVTT
ncbi:DMT family transporter [Pseudomonas sp. B21-048]|uniref:DMT family transporter n=1 Tax=Pseudomonas sp. B21-048 TaxID=2895490 RepID=UPI00215E2922|nr:EamA family transporter [Pseudomonas sp. B21-048]UVL00422.1 EamA family transporter [Pseudomonas sp. B21-048]